jgi:hypothetical protein
MIWFRLKKLERKLAKRELSEHNAFRYLMTYLLVFVTLMALPEVSSYSGWNWDISHYIITLLLTIGATYTSFRINEKGDNRDFLKRFISLAFVIGVWVLIGVLLLRLIYKIILFVVPLDVYNTISNIITTDLFQWLSSLAGIIIFYWLLLRSFKNVQKFAEHRRKEIRTESQVL